MLYPILMHMKRCRWILALLGELYVWQPCVFLRNIAIPRSNNYNHICFDSGT
jgi:hypothetical protein